MMRVGVYFSPWSRSLSPTGVGRHAIEMTSALAAHPEVDASRFTTRSDHERVLNQLPESISRMPVRFLPGSETMSRWMLMGLPFWKIDDDARDLDWIYCTKEQPVSVRKCKLAVNVHDVLPFEPSVPGLPEHRSRRSRFKWRRIIERIRTVDLITTISAFTRDRLIDMFQIPEERFAVVGNGVSDEYFRGPQPDDGELLAAYGIESGKYFLAVGSLTWRKGGDLLLEAAARLQQQGIDVPILMTGRRHDADLLYRHQEQVARDAAYPLKLLGFIPDRDQRVLMSNSIALVFPSRYEGFGIPALEAMAAETMVICSGTSALPEVVGDAAALIDPLDAETLVERMTEAVEAPYRRQELIERGRIRVQDFRWKQCADRLVKAMQDRN